MLIACPVLHGSCHYVMMNLHSPPGMSQHRHDPCCGEAGAAPRRLSCQLQGHHGAC